MSPSWRMPPSMLCHAYGLSVRCHVGGIGGSGGDVAMVGVEGRRRRWGIMSPGEDRS